MAKNKEKTEKQEESFGPADRLQSFFDENKEDHYNFSEAVDYNISTGSLTMDSKCKGLGLGPGCHRFCGYNNMGKTPLAIQVMNNFMDTRPNGRGVYLRTEGKSIKTGSFRSKRPFVTNPSEWTKNNIFMSESNILEFNINLLKKLILENEEGIEYCIVVDSFDNMILKDDSKKEIKDAYKVAGLAMSSKKFFQALGLPLAKFGHMAIFISQVTAEIKLDTYSPLAPRGGMFSGGNALLHASDYIFEFGYRYPGDYITDNPAGKINDGKSKPLGHWTTLTIRKSPGNNRDERFRIPIAYGRPVGKDIWIEYEIVDGMRKFEMVTAKGTWLATDPDYLKDIRNIEPEFPDPIQGERQYREILEKYPKVAEMLYDRIRLVVSTQ